MTRAALYLRVSTDRQESQNQEHVLRKYAEAKGYEITAVYADDAVSGGSVEESRDGFGRMMRAASQRKFDVVLVFALDRLSRRGIGPVFNILGALKSCGVGWESLNEPWASDAGPAGEIMLAILAWAADLERKRIGERTRASMARRKALGLPMGRPKGRKDTKPRTRRWAKRPQTGSRDEAAPQG